MPGRFEGGSGKSSPNARGESVHGPEYKPGPVFRWPLLGNFAEVLRNAAAMEHCLAVLFLCLHPPPPQTPEACRRKVPSGSQQLTKRHGTVHQERLAGVITSSRRMPTVFVIFKADIVRSDRAI